MKEHSHEPAFLEGSQLLAVWETTDAVRPYLQQYSAHLHEEFRAAMEGNDRPAAPAPDDDGQEKEWKDRPERLLDSLIEWTKSRGKVPSNEDAINARQRKNKMRKRGWIP
jgi:hypothetical protein